MILVEAISREFRVALPWELLYADDLVVIAETEDDLIKRLDEWKDNVEIQRHESKYEYNQGYNQWRTSEASTEGCKMAMWRLR